MMASTKYPTLGSDPTETPRIGSTNAQKNSTSNNGTLRSVSV